MRMVEWTPDMVRFMRDASENTGFYNALADALVACLGGAECAASMHLLDAGCGLGYLSLALARRCRHVTAIDRSAAAIQALRENVRQRGVANVEPRLADVYALPARERYDAMIFCLFGPAQKALALAAGRCERLIIVKKNWATRRFSLTPGLPERDTLDATLRGLDALGVSYEKRFVSLALDQPFRSVEDAVRFFRLYGEWRGSPEEEELAVRRRLVPGPSEAFPWLLPARRELGILTLAPPKAPPADS